MNIKEILNVLKKRWYLLVLIPLLFAIITAAYSYVFIPNIYTSTVSLYIWQNTNIYTEQATDNNGTSSSKNNTNENNTESKTQDRKNIQGDITFNNMIAKDISTFIKSNMITKAVMEELGLSSLSNYIISTNIDSSGKSSNNDTSTRIINITVSGNDAESVAQIANCYAKKTSEIVTKFINVDAINVLENAQPSTSPSGPPRNLYISVAAAAGLCVALIIILIISYFDSSIKTKKELEKAFKLPVLGQVPYIRKTK